MVSTENQLEQFSILTAFSKLPSLASLSAADFIQNYVWDYTYLTLFYGTQRLSLMPRSGSAAAEKTATLPIKVTLHYYFLPNEGANPDDDAISHLIAQTMSFFHTVFFEDETFSNILQDIAMADIDHEYSEDIPDEFILTFTANIVVDSTSDGTVSSRDAALLMGGSDLNNYVHEYVRKSNDANERNVFFQVRKVSFRGVGHM